METRKLGNTDMDVSILSYGASSLGSVFHETDDDEGIEAVHVAVDHGINFIDVSPYYGMTKAERVLGRALRQIDRGRYYLATKVGQYGPGDFDFSAARVKQSVDESRERLGLEMIDLIQCHDIEFAEVDQIVNETLPALHELKQQGVVRYVGITGLPVKVLKDCTLRVESGVIDTVLSFCRYSLNDHALSELFAFFEERGIGIINAAPTSMGLLTTRGVPDWHPAPMYLISHCAQVAQKCADRGWDIGHLAMQFACKEPRIATTLVGTANPKRMLTNIQSVEAAYDQQAIDQVLEWLAPVLNFNYTRGLPENQDAIIA